MAGRLSRRLRAWAKVNNIPLKDCRAGDQKHEIGEEYLKTTAVEEGLFLILVSRAPAPVGHPPKSPDHTENAGDLRESLLVPHPGR